MVMRVMWIRWEKDGLLRTMVSRRMFQACEDSVVLKV